ncbi:DUF4817 domain-containing protein [Trichonephila clavipes]|nr:DUF4817 domain-containing protein [Trichonephila clavipes]
MISNPLVSLKTHREKELQNVKYIKAEGSLDGTVEKLEEWSTRSGVVFVTRFTITSFVTNSSTVALEQREARGMLRGSVEGGEWDICVAAFSNMLLSKQQRAFAVEAYFSNGWSVISMQRVFRRQFDILPRGRVLVWKCILMWIDVFRATGNVSKERKGPPQTVRTPENVGRVLVSIQTGMRQ